MNKKSEWTIILHIIIFLLIILSVHPLMEDGTAKKIPKIEDTSPIAIQYSPSVLLELPTQGTVIGHELLWKANTTGTNYEESAVAYLDGIAYVGSCSTHGDGHDKLFAIDTKTGEILWSALTGPGYVGPVIDGDVVYYGTSTHCHEPGQEYMYAINRFTGEEIWKREIYGGIPESVQYDDQKLYFCADCGGNKIYALNKNDGTINWTFHTFLDHCPNKPMLKGNALYAAYHDSPAVGELYKINASNGKLIWKISLPGGPWDNSITADSEGRIFIAVCFANTIDAYNETDGSLLWRYPLYGRSLSFNAYHNGIVFIADTLGYIYALDSATGSLIWEKKVGNKFDISSPTLSAGMLFIGTRDSENGAFYVLNETTGELLWKYHIGASITAPPSIADGLMLCGTDDWHTYAFDFGVGDADWTLHRFDSLNTAYSPRGLVTWQYIEATCTGTQENVVCKIENHYDHVVSNIRLENSFTAYWYDSERNLLKAQSDNYTLSTLDAYSSQDLIITKNPFLTIKITKPLNALYINDREILATSIPISLGKITIETEVNYQMTSNIERVEFYVNDELKEVLYGPPFSYLWDEQAFLRNSIKAIAYTDDNLTESDEILIWAFNLGF